MLLFFKHFDLKKHICQKQNFANYWVVRNGFAIKKLQPEAVEITAKLNSKAVARRSMLVTYKLKTEPQICDTLLKMGWLELECIWFSSLVDSPICFVTWCPWVHFVFVTCIDVVRVWVVNQRYFHVFFLGWIGIQQHFSSWYGFGMVFVFVYVSNLITIVFFSLDSLKSTSISGSYCVFFCWCFCCWTKRLRIFFRVQWVHFGLNKVWMINLKDYCRDAIDDSF